MLVGGRRACCVFVHGRNQSTVDTRGEEGAIPFNFGFVSAQVWHQYRSGRCPASPELMVSSVSRKAGVIIQCERCRAGGSGHGAASASVRGSVVRHTMDTTARREGIVLIFGRRRCCDRSEAPSPGAQQCSPTETEPVSSEAVNCAHDRGAD